MSDTEKVKVENVSDAPVWIPGGEVEPGQTRVRPDSEQLQELVKGKVLAVVDDEDEKKADEKSSGGKSTRSGEGRKES